jgi:hypothetical protein
MRRPRPPRGCRAIGGKKYYKIIEEALLVASKEVGLEVNVDKHSDSSCLFSRRQGKIAI